MTDPHTSHDNHDPIAGETGGHHGPDFKLYMIIFGALLVCTSISFIANQIFTLGDMRSVIIIMLVSICKATLVAMFFMHLKYDWMKLYFLVFPVVILTVMMVIVLLPDIVLTWHTPDTTIHVEQGGSH